MQTNAKRDLGLMLYFAVSAAMLLILTPAAQADILTITHDGSGSGTLDGTPFTSLDFIIMGTVDTNNRETDGGSNPAFWIDHSSASIFIQGLGTFDFLVGTRHFVFNGDQIVGFARAGDEEADLFNGPSNPAFASWDMLTPIGPISGNDAQLITWGVGDIVTTGGVLIFNNESSISSTFTATAIPEPATLAFFVIGGLGLILRRRRSHFVQRRPQCGGPILGLRRILTVRRENSKEIRNFVDHVFGATLTYRLGLLGSRRFSVIRAEKQMTHTRFTRLLRLAVVATCCLAWSSSSVLAQGVTFDWATVGNAGNAPDQLYTDANPDSLRFGAVNYDYRISKHEVTNAQYTTFLNSVGATDTNGLYNTNMGSEALGGITQTGSSGSLTYSVRANMGNKPVNYVSIFDAMRFTNWLENGQAVGMQNASTTEAGVYTIGSGLDEVRNTSATYFIPSEDEWYKAAYHKNDGVTGNYFLYATSSDTVPTIATADPNGNISNPGGNVANYLNGADWNSQDGNVTTVGSAGDMSISPYGTFDQAGNVFEWNEAVIISSWRGARGGSWDFNEEFLPSSRRFNHSPSFEGSIIGFRVASSIPEPTSLLTGTLGTIGLLLRRRR